MCFKYTVLHFYCVAYRGLTTKNLVSICHSDLGFAFQLFSFQLSSGFPGGLDGQESACNAGDLVPSLGQENTLEKGMATTSVFLPGDSMDRGARRATVQGVERSVERRQID